MSLRTKILIAVTIVLLASVAIYFSIFRLVVFRSFLDLEQEEAQKDIHRCISAVDREIEHLSQFVHDWAAWDDTYRYIQDQNPGYRESNLVFDSFAGRKLNMIQLYDKAGNLVWGKIYDLQTKKEIRLNDFSVNHLPATHPLLRHDIHTCAHGGIWMTELGPMIVSSHGITTSDLNGPILGSLMMGFFLDDAYVQILSRQVQVAFRVDPIVTAEQKEQKKKALAILGPTQAVGLEEESEEKLKAYVIYKDLLETPALLFEADIPRDISQRGIQALDLASLFIYGSGIILLVTIFLLLHWLLIRPITMLTRTILEIGRSKELKGTEILQRKDEIGVLSREFDTMIRQLAQARMDLMDQSYQAGMARQATDVLHSVGNVLNTVNISTDLLEEKIERSSARSLQKAADLMDQRREDLAAFLSTDPKGRLLPDYLRELAGQIEQEHHDWQGLVASLKKNIDHLKQIVNMQQNYATTSGVRVSINPKELMEDALVICEAGLGRHRIDLQREYRNVPDIVTDKQKVLQILVNLIGNAKDSIIHFKGALRRLTLRLTQPSDDCVQFDIIDSGEGIEPEHLEKLFRHGFTTKKQGHGFGLHSSANLAGELGGSLKAFSEGPGKGATFSLVIPMKPR